MADADLNFIARQSERIVTGLASLRDDMAVLTAMVIRLDGSMTGLLQEMRATHGQIARMNDGIRKLGETLSRPDCNLTPRLWGPAKAPHCFGMWARAMTAAHLAMSPSRRALSSSGELAFASMPRSA